MGFVGLSWREELVRGCFGHGDGGDRSSSFVSGGWWTCDNVRQRVSHDAGSVGHMLERRGTPRAQLDGVCVERQSNVAGHGKEVI